MHVVGGVVGQSPGCGGQAPGRAGGGHHCTRTAGPGRGRGGEQCFQSSQVKSTHQPFLDIYSLHPCIVRYYIMLYCLVVACVAGPIRAAECGDRGSQNTPTRPRLADRRNQSNFQ